MPDELLVAVHVLRNLKRKKSIQGAVKLLSTPREHSTDGLQLGQRHVDVGGAEGMAELEHGLEEGIVRRRG